MYKTVQVNFATRLLTFRVHSREACAAVQSIFDALEEDEAINASQIGRAFKVQIGFCAAHAENALLRLQESIRRNNFEFTYPLLEEFLREEEREISWH